MREVRAVSSNEYQFAIPLTDLPDLNRIALGIRDSATHMLVRLQLSSSSGVPFAKFCVHLPPDDNEIDLYHKYGSGLSTEEDSQANDRYFRIPCTRNPNFLTHLVVTGLKNVLQGQEESLRHTPAARIRDLLIWIAQETSNHITRRCIISSESFGPSLGIYAARPMARSPKCRDEFEEWPLGVRISPLLRDPAGFDLLLTCLATQLRSIVWRRRRLMITPILTTRLLWWIVRTKLKLCSKSSIRSPGSTPVLPCTT